MPRRFEPSRFDYDRRKGTSMATPHVRTATPGIYKRGKSYVVKQRDRTGRMHTKSAPTLAAARLIQAELRAEGAYGAINVEGSHRFDDYARSWIRTYAGRTSRGLRDSTRAEYESALSCHAVPFFGRMRLSEITPRDIKEYVQSCSDKGLSRHGVKNALCPVKAMLATAFEDGDIRVNPSSNVRVIVRAPEDNENHEVRALTEAELEAFIAAVPANHRLLIRFLACTGLRIGEAAELRWKDVDLATSRLYVRRAVYRGVVGPPKSKYGVRTVPLTSDLVQELTFHRVVATFSGADDPVFPSRSGSRLDAHNIRTRVIHPVAETPPLEVACECSQCLESTRNRNRRQNGSCESREPVLSLSHGGRLLSAAQGTTCKKAT